jgi:hypothetical protein
MVLRIRFGMGRQVQRSKGKNRKLALALSALLTPGAVMASALGFWRLAADMHWTGEFGIASARGKKARVPASKDCPDESSTS